MTVCDFQNQVGFSDLAIQDLKTKHYSRKYESYFVFDIYVWCRSEVGKIYYKKFNINFNRDYVRFCGNVNYFIGD